MKRVRRIARRWHLVGLVALVCLLASGCESLIDGIGDSLTHDSDVRHYENHGVSPQQAERRVFEDNYFDHMDAP
jgi:hypothetical protein